MSDITENLDNDEAKAQVIGEAPIDRDCPICLRRDQNFVHGNCGHCFCQPCLQRIMLSPSLSTRPDRFLTSDSATTVTLNFCPICRERIGLYDIVHQRREEGGAPNKNDKEPVYKSEDFRKTPLAGAIFSERGQLGLGSFHFPPHTEGDDCDDPGKPYYDLSKTPVPIDHKRKIELEEVTLHSDSRTLSAVLRFPSGYFDEWKIFLTFDSEWQTVRRGLIIKNRRIVKLSDFYPLDGVWCVQTGRSGDQGGRDSRVVKVVGNVFYDDFGDLHYVKANTKDKSRPLVTVQNMATGEIILDSITHWDWTKKPKGPEVGALIEFEATRAVFGGEVVVWKRDAVSNELPPDGISTIGGNSGRYYRRISNEPLLKPTHNEDSIWGNVFCQVYKVGLASYHFVDPENIYVSYEHPGCAQWSLENGAPMPCRVKFKDAHFPDPHTFRGSILWKVDYDLTCDGAIRWEYEMQFDASFACIVDGACHCIYEAGREPLPIRFGKSLVYINAAIYDKFVSELKTRNAKEVWELGHGRRLAEQNARTKTIEMLHNIIIKASFGAGNPVDYNA